MINEHRFHSTLGVDAKYIRVYRYFDDVWQLLMTPAGVRNVGKWVASKVEALEKRCYPASLRLLQNSLGVEANMLSCVTRVAQGGLVCVHNSRNKKYVEQGLLPSFACFLPAATAHARRKTVLRTGLIGLMHRMHMDTQPKDVPLLLPVLLAYAAELRTLQHPVHYLCRAFESFLRHCRVSESTNSQLWYDLYSSFCQSVHSTGWE